MTSGSGSEDNSAGTSGSISEETGEDPRTHVVFLYGGKKSKMFVEQSRTVIAVMDLLNLR